MKIKLISAVLIMTLFVGACSDDTDTQVDSNDLNANACVTCTIASVTTRYCDNGNGTVSFTTDGVTQTIDREESSFEAFITGLDNYHNGSCN